MEGGREGRRDGGREVAGEGCRGRGRRAGGAVGWKTAPSCGTAAAWPQGRGEPRAGGLQCRAAAAPSPRPGPAPSRRRPLFPPPWDGASQPAPPVPQFPPPQQPASLCLAPGSRGSTPPLTPATLQLRDPVPRPAVSRAGLSSLPGVGDGFEDSRRGRVWGQRDQGSKK